MSEQGRGALLDDLLAETLRWLPDETLFSLVCRYHRLSVHGNPALTQHVLFSRRQSKCSHDFCGHLDAFVLRTEGCLGDAEVLIRQRTLAPCFLAFRATVDCHSIRQAMRSGQLHHVKYLAGITTSRFRGQHPLKACKRCMEHDIERFGTTYWHLPHQLPGAWRCLIHQDGLLATDEAGTVDAVRCLQLPHLAPLNSLASPWRKLTVGLASVEALNGMAHAVWQLHSEPEGKFQDTVRLALTYRDAMSRRGLIGKSGRVCWGGVLEEFRAFVAPLTAIPDFAMIETTDRGLRNFLTRLLYEPRSRTHPLRHLIMVGWLFENWEMFRQAFDNAAEDVTTIHSSNSSAALPSHAATCRERGEIMLREGCSPTAVAKALEVDVMTACNWAASIGFQVKRRPKFLNDVAREAMKVALMQGQDKMLVAEKAKVSIASVTRILRTEPGLQAHWHQVRYLLRMETERQRWLDLNKRIPGVGVKQLRAFAPETFAWLYRNDRVWLKDQSMTRGVGANHAHARWERRDDALSTDVQKAASWASQSGSHHALTLEGLCHLIPELRVRLGQLAQLPRTLRAIELALQSSHSFLEMNALQSGLADTDAIGRQEEQE